MSAQQAIQRLSKEREHFNRSRVREFYAAPLDDDIFVWHFTLLGPPDSPYAEGLYHGVLRFSHNYPFSPPDISFLTNSGRFEVGKSICSSISRFHPERWQPRYDVPLILVALRAFMAQDDEGGIGALARQYVSVEEKRRLARQSHSFSCADCGMESAERLWKEEMENQPPVGAEVEANVPQLPNRKRAEGADGAGGRGGEPVVVPPKITDDATEKGVKEIKRVEGESETVVPGVRLRLGRTLTINVPYSLLDGVIQVCLGVCAAVLAKKAFWF